MSVTSPCRKICQYDRARGVCATCWRTLDEIAGWAAMPDEARLAVLDACRAREAAEI